MLKCREIVEQADALLDGEVGLRRRLAIRMHLFMCHHCRRYLRQLQWLLRAIPHMHGKADEADVDRVIAAIGESKKSGD